MKPIRPSRRIKELHTDDIQIPEAYQRELDQPRINRIASKFDPELYGVFTVRKEGDHYVIADGQNRLQAIKKLYPEGTYVDCQITTKPLHVAMITCNSDGKPFNNNQKFWCNHAGGVSSFTFVTKAVSQETNIKMSKKESKGRLVDGVCKCAWTLWEIKESLGHKRFRFMLSMLQRYFTRPDGEMVEAAALSSRFLKGFAKFIYNNDEFAAQKRLDRNKLSAADIDQRAKRAENVSDGNRSNAIHEIFKSM